jgi:hypothetical protein
MDSSKKRLNDVETIDLSDLSFTSTSMNSGNYTIEPLTISSISLTDTLNGPSGTTYSIGGAVGADGNVIGGLGTSPMWTTNTTGIDWSMGANIKPSGSIELRGEDADIKVNGRSLMDAIDALEQRLNILVPNPELEKEWDELRELGERYRELEKKCKEKGEMWAKLKQMPPPEVK